MDDPDELDKALRALADRRRREILRLVASTELSAGEIAAAFDVTRPAVSQHLTVLRDAGLLQERRDGTRRLLRPSRQGLDVVRRFFDDLWDQALDRGRQLVEEEGGGGDPRAGRDTG